MRGHRRSVSVPRTVKSLPQRSRTPSRKVEKKPDWNDTIGTGDLSKMKLTAEELRNRRLQRVSKNRFFMDQAKAMLEGDEEASHARPLNSDVSLSNHESRVDQDSAASIDVGVRLNQMQSIFEHDPKEPQMQQPLSLDQQAAAAAEAMAEAASKYPSDLKLHPYTSSQYMHNTTHDMSMLQSSADLKASPRRDQAAFRRAEVLKTPASKEDLCHFDGSHSAGGVGQRSSKWIQSEYHANAHDLDEGLEPKDTFILGANSSTLLEATFAPSRVSLYQEDAHGSSALPAHEPSTLLISQEASQPPNFYHNAGTTTDTINMQDLLTRQSQSEKRVLDLEAKIQGVGNSSSSSWEMESLRGELKRLAEDNHALRKELSEFSAHTSTMMLHLHDQVAQLMRLQSSAQPGLSLPQPSSLLEQLAPVGMLQANAAASTAAAARSWEHRGPQSHLMGHSVISQTRLSHPVVPTSTVLGVEMSKTSRSIFHDLPTATKPASLYPSMNKSAPTATTRPDSLLRSPIIMESPTRGKPVTSVDDELEKLPTFAAFRRSAVISATKNAHPLGVTARPTGATQWEAPSSPFSGASVPTTTGPGEFKFDQEPSLNPASSVSETGWGLAQYLNASQPTLGTAGSTGYVNNFSPTQAYGATRKVTATTPAFTAEESKSMGAADQTAYSTVAATSAGFARPLPTEFQPRSLGHASILVQHGRSSENLFLGMDTTTVAATGILGYERDSSGDSLSPHHSQMGAVSASFDSKAAAFEAIRNAGGSRSPPRGAGGVGSMSLAAHATAAAMHRRQHARLEMYSSLSSGAHVSTLH
ncbi:hypothetical protein CEUSTIGMA_g6558.t1 [Chlamydomonas eustigma]|uniref:Uncharacterized protein n=1 Tax=Chlamydomonas eustigma TaxID=1157962 RepID=A0A250X7Q9_9CHLO|nr:hypothetical protein CEUSTIGMA_g6558.t1 [Chlamydomonas eustigma]|eukprot:GAX79118.1 hypothetical protein CEUSTIGMA_g6558.t1 [Chlamydomonas eustigma]